MNWESIGERECVGSEGAQTTSVPPWVMRLLEDGAQRPPVMQGRTVLSVTEARGWTLASVRVPEASALGQQGIENVTAQAYLRIRNALDDSDAVHAVRTWNFIPAIRRRYAPDLDQYMAFNAGRHAAYASKTWFGVGGRGEAMMPTASAVGHGGDDLVIHVLGCDRSGRAVENPRQVSAYHYSRRYGPKPPCFARATAIEREGPVILLMVGGTASVVGEDSRHAEDPELQITETLRNLEQLVHAADLSRGDAMHAFADLRVYFTCDKDLPIFTERIAARFAAHTRVEWVAAELCRQELLVEIEGLIEAGDEN